MISFRIIPSHLDDLGKNRIRIEKDQMKKLGVSSGDVVSVIGTRTTAATCLPLDSKVLSHDPEFEFFYDTGKRLPVVRLSDIVSYNARGNNLLSVVQMEKVEPTKAGQITLSARDIFSYKKENLVLSSIEEAAFAKGDCIRVANTGHETKFPFVEFVIVDASPAGNSYVITKDTKIEFAPYKTKISHVPQLSNLKRTIHLGNKVSEEKLEITLESLEVYDEGCKFSLDVGYSLDDPKEWVENRMYAIMSAYDNTGKVYRCVDLRAGKSHWNIGKPQYTTLSGTMIPAINENASKMVFEIKEITWQQRQKRDLQFLDQISEVIREEPTVVSIWQQHKLYHIIAQGTWRFDIDLK